MVEPFMSRFGLPLELHSEQSRNFDIAVFEKPYSLLGIMKDEQLHCTIHIESL